jgi:aldehyde:ferredoxin oxidoreductase
MTHAYVGKILRANLRTGRISEEEINEKAMRKYFGGRGIGARILFNELRPGIDPFGPENKLIFAVGPLTGTPFPGNSRYVVMGKSPLTGILGEANAAGYFGPELKHAGYDAIIIEDVAAEPVYLWVHNSEAKLCDAKHLWGKITGDTEKTIRKEVKDEKVRVACIGPAGENLVRFACVISDLNRAAGRCGLGAVMGSKKLKAIAVRGTQEIELADREKFREFAKIAARDTMTGKFSWGEGLRKYGTDGDMFYLHSVGCLPTKAFTKCTFSGADKISGETMAQTILVRRSACPYCSVGCIRVVETKEPYVVDPAYGGPEYETCAAFGSLCMNDNLVAVAKANELCNKYSLDTISTGVAIAFAMECYEKGLITREEANGLELSWGNDKAILQLVEKIAVREGIGNILAEGVKIAAEKIGKGAEKFALHIKGLELAMHEPRGKKGMGLSFVTSNIGASHLQSHHDEGWEKEHFAPEIGWDNTLIPRSRTDLSREKVKITKISQDLMSAYNTLVVCRFTQFPAGPSIGNLLGIITAVTGWNVTADELITVGERAYNLCRAFIVREGITRKDDTLPARLFEPLTEGSSRGEVISKSALDTALDYYYELRGWDKNNGIPTRKKLEELGLDYVAEELEKLGKL